MTVSEYIDTKKQEGKRCVYWFRPMHGSLAPDGPQQLIIIAEHERGYVPLGELSNMPGTTPPLVVMGKQNAEESCLCWNAMDPMEVFKIVASSMRPDEIKALLDSDTERVAVLVNGDEVCSLEWAVAENLYTQLKRLGCRCSRT